MSDLLARRKFPRFEVQLPFRYTAGNGVSPASGAGWTRSLSEGGATVELSERLRLLTPVQLRLRADQSVVEAEGQVVWSGRRAPKGGGLVHGLSFTQIAPGQILALQEMFRPLSFMRHAGARLSLDVGITCHPKNPAGPPLQGRTGNANRGGLFLRLPRLLPPRAVLDVTLHIPKDPLTVGGTVVWVEPPEIWKPGESIGHGIQFIDPEWSTLVYLGLLLVEPS